MSFTGKNLKQKKQLKAQRGKLEDYTRDAEVGSSGDTGDNNTGGQDITTTIQQGQRGAQRLIYTHREGRGNWPQVEHMRTGADNHRQEVKKENTLETETTK